MSVGPVLISRFNAKWIKDEKSDCHLWVGAKLPKGYGIIKLPGERRQIYAHRLSYLIHKGEIPDRMQVLHSCDCPSCVNPAHLTVGTSADNQQDMKAKDRSTHGEKNAQAKLTEAQVKEMYALKAQGVTSVELGERFGVHEQHVNRVLRGTRWERLAGPRPKRGPRPQLSDQDVLAVRALWEGGVRQETIAKVYDVSQTTISRIVRRRRRATVGSSRDPALASLTYRRGR